MRNGLVHPLGDVDTLAEQISIINDNRDLLTRLRSECLRSAAELTWRKAGVRLLEVYESVLNLGHAKVTREPAAVSFGV
jgi:glycosyltransferase involved in cell wall biosynthesis